MNYDAKHRASVLLKSMAVQSCDVTLLQGHKLQELPLCPNMPHKVCLRRLDKEWLSYADKRQKIQLLT
jgi:hypothetical protein